ncbi:molybdopterin-synthase adenylyltransferase MoeB [Luteibaculum oceani]|uniref:Molybdopterin-synthase adenylyltransferase n=1 Tax=Luteibaculum oceani TaxID=1294296 RepID=A0A5C6UYM8_9FLAO|nr:molybdopterin-synthase adenylyltransferase MoeB [Luteibaculum oceani]TXC76068.1 molybdopterin-synthase adenylyltransferase MoeB [Luteibaculum oceani]
MESLSQSELKHYQRQVILPEIGVAGQEALKRAKVLVVGAGGLGVPLLQYLVAAGVGEIGIVDADSVDITNLHRQVLYSVQDEGMSKAKVAEEKLKRLNPHVKINAIQEFITRENACSIIREYDIVADGTDNFATRYLINDACVIEGKTNVFASITQFKGQVSVFNFKYEDGSFGPNYRDLFPEPPLAGSVPSCAEAGVIGVLPGLLGTMQANEVIKIITKTGKPLVGTLLIYDSLTTILEHLDFERDPNNPFPAPSKDLVLLDDYEVFCGTKTEVKMKEISVQELKAWQDEKKDFQFIDVREPFEYDEANLGAELIPVGDVEMNKDKISKDKDVVIHCRSGARSANVILYLEQNHGYTNLYNLKGGILAYQKEIGL